MSFIITWHKLQTNVLFCCQGMHKVILNRSSVGPKFDGEVWQTYSEHIQLVDEQGEPCPPKDIQPTFVANRLA